MHALRAAFPECACAIKQASLRRARARFVARALVTNTASYLPTNICKSRVSVRYPPAFQGFDGFYRMLRAPGTGSEKVLFASHGYAYGYSAKNATCDRRRLRRVLDIAREHERAKMERLTRFARRVRLCTHEVPRATRSQQFRFFFFLPFFFSFFFLFLLMVFTRFAHVRVGENLADRRGRSVHCVTRIRSCAHKKKLLC